MDVALVVKNDKMFSAAQAHRRQLSQRWEQKLGPRLASAAARLADLAASERLCIFLGAGVSVNAGLPEWQQLLQALAARPEVPLAPEEVRQLATLGLPDQAAVVASRLGTPAPPTVADRTTAEDAGGLETTEAECDNGEDGVTGRGAAPSGGDDPLASLVVDELSSPQYSITHGLLAGLPVCSFVTTVRVRGSNPAADGGGCCSFAARV
jgi:hypothetical protein